MGRHNDDNPHRDDSHDTGRERRIDSRLPMLGLTCDRGRIVDLSETGARIETRRPWKEGAVRPVTISDELGAVTIPGRCVWLVREGFLRHSMGVHFVSVSAEQAQSLARIAAAFAVETMSDGYRQQAA